MLYDSRKISQYPLYVSSTLIWLTDHCNLIRTCYFDFVCVEWNSNNIVFTWHLLPPFICFVISHIIWFRRQIGTVNLIQIRVCTFESVPSWLSNNYIFWTHTRQTKLATTTMKDNTIQLIVWLGFMPYHFWNCGWFPSCNRQRSDHGPYQFCIMKIIFHVGKIWSLHISLIMTFLAWSHYESCGLKT